MTTDWVLSEAYTYTLRQIQAVKYDLDSLLLEAHSSTTFQSEKQRQMFEDINILCSHLQNCRYSSVPRQTSPLSEP